MFKPMCFFVIKALIESEIFMSDEDLIVETIFFRWDLIHNFSKYKKKSCSNKIFDSLSSFNHNVISIVLCISLIFWHELFDLLLYYNHWHYIIAYMIKVRACIISYIFFFIKSVALFRDAFKKIGSVIFFVH